MNIEKGVQHKYVSRKKIKGRWVYVYPEKKGGKGRHDAGAKVSAKAFDVGFSVGDSFSAGAGKGHWYVEEIKDGQVSYKDDTTGEIKSLSVGDFKKTLIDAHKDAIQAHVSDGLKQREAVLEAAKKYGSDKQKARAEKLLGDWKKQHEIAETPKKKEKPAPDPSTPSHLSPFKNWTVKKTEGDDGSTTYGLFDKAKKEFIVKDLGSKSSAEAYLARKTAEQVATNAQDWMRDSYDAARNELKALQDKPAFDVQPVKKARSQALKRTKAFESQNPARYNLIGTFFDGKGSAMATDGHRLAIIPTDVTEKGNTTDAAFPNVQSVIDGTKKHIYHTVSASAIEAAISHLSQYASGDPEMRVRITVNVDGINLTTQKAPSERQPFLSISSQRGNDFAILSVNPQYILDALKGAKGGVQIGLSSKKKDLPLVIKRQDGEQHYIMPVKN